jgi:hypothetical protein
MTETIIIIADIKNIKCIDIINLLTATTPVALSNSPNDPVKMCCVSCNGIIWVKTKNTRPILKALPVITIVVLIPAATPLLWGGTELIVVALLGEANIPIPDPNKTSGKRDSWKGSTDLIPESIKKPIADIVKPIGVNICNLNRSNNHPLMGANAANDMETGIR